MTSPPPLRLALALARAGVASRRQAERIIGAGRVAVNGKTIINPATLVTPEDRLTLDHRTLDIVPPTPRLWLLAKPAGVLTHARAHASTHADASAPKETRTPTVDDILPDGMARLIPVGRLDMMSEGLLLLTNHGELAHHLASPAGGYVRIYRVRVRGTVHAGVLAQLRQTKPLKVSLARGRSGASRTPPSTRANQWLEIHLGEGRNRQVRRMCTAAGLQVNRLIRTHFGPFHLGAMPRRGLLEVPPTVLARKLPAFFNRQES